MTNISQSAWTTIKLDGFGAIERSRDNLIIRRNTRRARPQARLIARFLARREARALIALTPLHGIPKLQTWDGTILERDNIPGHVLHAAGNLNELWFKDAARLLRRMHSYNVAHNDLAKEANCLVKDDGSAAFIDFQLALHAPNRGRIFRLLAREDIRHLLKHKRTYVPAALTTREHAILASPSLPARLWMQVYKPVYLWVTRSILRWPERKGPVERVLDHSANNTETD